MISGDAKDIIDRWAQAGHACYIRPMTSRYLYPNRPHRVWWIVQVEVSGVSLPVREEGLRLSDCIIDLDKKVGDRKGRKKKQGWLAPAR